MANEMAKMVEDTNTFLAAQVEPEGELTAVPFNHETEGETAAEAIPAAKPKPKAKKAKPAPVEVEVEVETIAPKVGVCARVHQIADAMKGQPRAEIIAAAIAEGINKGTVRVQLGHWAKKQPGGWTWPEEAASEG